MVDSSELYEFQLLATVLALATVATALPRPDKVEVVPILRDDRIMEDGHYSFDIETGDGIVRSEAGQPEGENGAVNQAGHFS